MSSQSIDSCGGLISLNVTLATTGPILLRNCYLSCGHACNRCILFEVGWGWKDHPPEQQCWKKKAKNGMCIKDNAWTCYDLVCCGSDWRSNLERDDCQPGHENDILEGTWLCCFKINYHVLHIFIILRIILAIAYVLDSQILDYGHESLKKCVLNGSSTSYQTKVQRKKLIFMLEIVGIEQQQCGSMVGT